MRYLLILLVILFSAALISFDSKPSKNRYAPPGTVPINDTLYFDRTEISNISWLEYQFWNKREYGDTAAAYLKTLPDTLVWNRELSYGEPFMTYYHSHPAYAQYPVVGINYHQATGYCRWRTGRVKELIETVGQKGRKEYPLDFTYRLPSKDEWEMVARAGYSTKNQKLADSKKYKDKMRHNMMRDNATGAVAGKLDDEVNFTAPVRSYFPNTFGVYNLIGNVAEIVMEAGIAKGGGWGHRQSEVSIERDFEYTKPEAWLGFRCACIIRWKE